MSLPWIRLDTALPDHPKILALIGHKDGRATAFVYICGMAYSGRHGTDGFIPREALPRINGRQSDADRLCDVGLWKDAGGFGWEINGWDEYQASDQSTKERSERARRAAEIRWGKKS
jgi:hypothetical protein